MDTLLTIEPGMLIWTFVVFFILLWVLKKFAWKPLLSSLEGRENAIRTDMERAENARAESERLLAEHKKLQDRSEIEARGIIEEARKTAEALKADIVEKANEQARNLTAQAKAEIQREKETALAQLRDEVADLAIQAASKILRESLDDEKHRKLVTTFISELPKN
jgi:F-type H+-transporting ATPase subunit b